MHNNVIYQYNYNFDHWYCTKIQTYIRSCSFGCVWMCVCVFVCDVHLHVRIDVSLDRRLCIYKYDDDIVQLPFIFPGHADSVHSLHCVICH